MFDTVDLTIKIIIVSVWFEKTYFFIHCCSYLIGEGYLPTYIVVVGWVQPVYASMVAKTYLQQVPR